jgi:hypothetical protein
MSGYRFFHIDPNGVEYPINDGVNTWLELKGMFGFGLMRLDVATERMPYEHGVTVIGEPYMPAREMGIAIGIGDTSHAAWVARDNALRDNCSPFRDPTQRCTLKVLRPDDTERRIGAWLVEYSGDSGDMDGPMLGRRVLTYWAPDPAFYDPTAVVTAFGVSPGGGLSFSMTFSLTITAAGDAGGLTWPLTFPMFYVAANVTTRQAVSYAGTMPTYPVVRCYGPADYPIIENVTLDKAVQVVQAMATGDWIDVDMSEQTATFHDTTDNSDTDATNLVTDDTQFWHLRPGENTIRVAMNGASSGGVRMTYTKKYLAV